MESHLAMFCLGGSPLKHIVGEEDSFSRAFHGCSAALAGNLFGQVMERMVCMKLSQFRHFRNYRAILVPGYP